MLTLILVLCNDVGIVETLRQLSLHPAEDQKIVKPDIQCRTDILRGFWWDAVNNADEP